MVLDASPAPSGHDLLQGCVALRPGEQAARARERIERLLDAEFAGWRERVVMTRRSVTASPGARDRVGANWRQRPAVDRGDGSFPAGDWVATPGRLSELCFTSAVAAAELAVQRVDARPAVWPNRVCRGGLEARMSCPGGSRAHRRPAQPCRVSTLHYHRLPVLGPRT
jgi:hypothetical protein